MNEQEFANKIRSKYPGAYDNISDTELTNKVTKLEEQSKKVDEKANQAIKDAEWAQAKADEAYDMADGGGTSSYLQNYIQSQLNGQ